MHMGWSGIGFKKNFERQVDGVGNRSGGGGRIYWKGQKGNKNSYYENICMGINN